MCIKSLFQNTTQPSIVSYTRTDADEVVVFVRLAMARRRRSKAKVLPCLCNKNQTLPLAPVANQSLVMALVTLSMAVQFRLRRDSSNITLEQGLTKGFSVNPELVSFYNGPFC